MTSTNTTITPPGTPPVKPRHRGRKILFGILAALALIVIGSVAAGSGGSHPAAAPSAGAKSNPAAQSTGSAVAHIGDKVRDGKFEFTVVKVTHAKSVGDTQYGLGETAQGRFTIMTLKARPSTTPPSTSTTRRGTSTAPAVLPTLTFPARTARAAPG